MRTTATGQQAKYQNDQNCFNHDSLPDFLSLPERKVTPKLAQVKQSAYQEAGNNKATGWWLWDDWWSNFYRIVE